MRANKSRRNHCSRMYHPYRLTPQHTVGKSRADHIPALQDQNRLQLQQQQQQLQQQALLAQSGFGSPAGAAAGAAAGVPAVDGGVINMPSYADQMQAAFIDYHRQRAEFEQQQHQLLQKLYHSYPDVSAARVPAQVQPQPPPLPAKGPQEAAGFPYQRPQFGSNGLQPAGSPRPSARSGPPPAVGAGDFYSTQQHMGFMQQQYQDVLREQQQLVAQQFATSQMAPTTRQSFGMAVPMSSVLAAPPFPPSSDFSGGDFNHSF